ncbi:PqqD family protein [Treponema pectinovorum]|uniref:PqqD family protein n=1 Tax=Treponema pectinovorum TaxID=164 RepID=UPI0011CBE324|nr:PqqD family protein [Treponema pectinovorum]
MKKKVKKLSANYMDIVFCHKVENAWRVKEDGLVEIDMENTGFFNKIAQKFFHKPKVSHIALDKYGTALWLTLDGNSSVLDIEKMMEEKFPTEKGKMLNRTVHFLGTLQANGFIIKKK